MAEMVKRSSALAELNIRSPHVSGTDEPAPDAAMIHAKAALKIALETRGPSFRYEIHPLYLPKPPAAAAPEASGD